MKKYFLFCFSIDRWDIWKHYINSVFELMTINNGISNNHVSGENNDLQTIDDSPEKCHEFICRIVERGVDNGNLTLLKQH